MRIECSSTDGDNLYDLVSHLLKIFQVLRWHYILNYIILLFNVILLLLYYCLNFIDIQFVVKRRKRPQIQTLVLIAFLLKRYQNYGTIWLEIFMTYGMNSSIWKTLLSKNSRVKTLNWRILLQNSDELCGAIRSKK